MKTFLEVIKEQPQNDKLDRLTHNIPLSNKRLKQLQRFSDLALMFDFEGWRNRPKYKLIIMAQPCWRL